MPSFVVTAEGPLKADARADKPWHGEGLDRTVWLRGLHGGSMSISVEEAEWLLGKLPDLIAAARAATEPVGQVAEFAMPAEDPAISDPEPLI